MDDFRALHSLKVVKPKSRTALKNALCVASRAEHGGESVQQESPEPSALHFVVHDPCFPIDRPATLETHFLPIRLATATL